jgi:hypothetical protein
MSGMGPLPGTGNVTGPGSSIPEQVAVAADADGNIEFAVVVIDPATGTIKNVSVTEQTGNAYVKTDTELVYTSNGTSGGDPRGRFGVTSGSVFRVRLRTGGPLGGIEVFKATVSQIDIFKKLFLGEVKSGSTQGTAGAAAGEVWKTSGHVSLPDNVLMIGV